MTPATPIPRVSDFGGLVLASASVLALQVTATRLFSFLIWYHFAFLVLSISFLGFTAGGLIAGAKGAAPDGDPRPTLSRLAYGAGLSVPCAFVTLSHLPLEPDFLGSARGCAVFLLAVLAMLVPFACLGAYICLALSAWPERIGALYAANLGGSALGCGLVVGLLDAVGVPSAFLSCGLLAWSAGMLTFRPSAARRWQWLVVALLALGSLAFVRVATDELSPLVYMKTTKAYPHLPRERVLARKSDSLSSVEMFQGVPTPWGLSPHFKRPLPEMVEFAIDGWALTSVFNRALTDIPDGVLDYLPAGLPYRLRPPRDVLVIGAGGGVDVLTALHYGARHVTGVEINPIIVDAVEHKYADLSGHLYQDPRVEMHVAEGRHFLKRDRRKYDLIQLSGVDTLAASQAGAFALHENYLYTVEAMHDYLNALAPGGMLTFTRWLYFPPRQTMRLMAIANRAFHERGVERPQDHMAVLESMLFTVLLIKSDPFTPSEIAALRAEIDAKSFHLIYAPYVQVNPLPTVWAENPFYAFWRVGPEPFVASYPLDIRPTTDDRPFFFEYQRWGGAISTDPVLKNQNAQVVLFATLIVCTLLCGVILLLARRRYRSVTARLGGAAHVYFIALGLGYIFVENVLVQRMILFLGSPAHALTVILFTLLGASGAGSALATRSSLVRRRAPQLMLLIGALLLLYAYLLRPVLDPLLGLELGLRVALVVVLIAPLGVLMGMPFPLAIERLTRADRRLVPFAWVINGAASVLGSVVTVIIAMSTGFTAVFWAAALLYGAAALSYARVASPSPAA